MATSPVVSAERVMAPSLALCRAQWVPMHSSRHNYWHRYECDNGVLEFAGDAEPAADAWCTWRSHTEPCALPLCHCTYFLHISFTIPFLSFPLPLRSIIVATKYESPRVFAEGPCSHHMSQLTPNMVPGVGWAWAVVVNVRLWGTYPEDCGRHEWCEVEAASEHEVSKGFRCVNMSVNSCISFLESAGNFRNLNLILTLLVYYISHWIITVVTWESCRWLQRQDNAMGVVIRPSQVLPIPLASLSPSPSAEILTSGP